MNDYFQHLVSLLCFLVLLIPVSMDTVLWISVIVIAAGNMVVGGVVRGSPGLSNCEVYQGYGSRDGRR